VAVLKAHGGDDVVEVLPGWAAGWCRMHADWLAGMQRFSSSGLSGLKGGPDAQGTAADDWVESGCGVILASKLLV